jgi:ribosomal-protein-alanine N-acetyltransferase
MTAAHAGEMAELERVCFSLPWSPRSCQEALDDPNGYWLAAEADGALAGYAGMQTVLDEGYIGNLAVAPRFRRKGLGRRLLEGLLREAKRRSLSFLTLEVRVSNAPAVALYRALGFAVEGTRPRYYEQPEEDAYLMTLRLT